MGEVKKRPPCRVTHAGLRAFERYGITLCGRDVGRIIGQITDGQAEKIRKLGQCLAVYEVWVQDQRCRILYNRKLKWIVTFLPKDDRRHRQE